MDEKREGVLSKIHFANSYERKARLVPALLAVFFGIPVAFAYGLHVTDWITLVLSGVGVGFVLAVGLSHLSSMAGNKFQKKLWPDWPYDSPTNIRLSPGTTSPQQQARWKMAIQTITSLNLDDAKNDTEMRLLVNDALTEVRVELWNLPLSSRLNKQNEDYGFARNFAGLRPIWITFAFLSCIGSWLAPWLVEAGFQWAIASTILLVIALLIGFLYLPFYVRQKAEYYTESFYSELMKLAETRSPISKIVNQKD